MHSMQSFLLIAAMAMCALAAPTPKALTKRSFSVPVAARNAMQLSPKEAMAKAYGKYGWEIIVISPDSTSSSDPFDNPFGGESVSSSAAAAPAATSSAASFSNGTQDAAGTGTATSASGPASSTTASSGSGETGEVTASPESDESEYLENVTVGGQALTLDFDTGSADLWVFSTALPSSESSGHTLFNPNQSTTWSTYEGGEWDISYGDGSEASGTVGYDHVTIGGVTATRQAVELATAVSGSFVTDTKNDGLVGLAFSTINTVQPQQQSTFFENVMDSLAQPLFTANLKDNATGLYTFGEIDESQYTGDISFTTIDKENGWWQFNSPTYTIGTTKSDCTTCSVAIADTGTSLLLLDADIVTAYYNQVDGASYDASQGGYTYTCGTTLPDFGVAIGSDFTATIPGSVMTYAQLSSTTCFGGLQSNQGSNLQIFGDMLLKQYFVVFDGGNDSLGFADKA